jgi:UTP--glucose-1-phosphate uridylyltransferase
MNKIKKAVIPAAGLGTRFLPITKTFAKEMLPIIDRPNLQYIAEECHRSGIEELILIINDDKPEIKDYFSRDLELEETLLEHGKTECAEMVKEVASLIKIRFVTQKKQLGLGNAVLCAKEAVGDEDFALILGDDLVFNEENPAIGQLIRTYEKTNHTILGIQKVEHDQVNKYGIISYNSKIDEKTYIVSSLVEKPKIEDTPSDLACVGRYILKNKIFHYLENIKPSKKGEYELTDALKEYLQNDEIDAYEFDGIRYDIGDKFGYIKATIDFALRRDDLKEEFKNYLRKLKL